MLTWSSRGHIVLLLMRINFNPCDIPRIELNGYLTVIVSWHGTEEFRVVWIGIANSSIDELQIKTIQLKGRLLQLMQSVIDCRFNF